jgi:transposase-like protein
MANGCIILRPAQFYRAVDKRGKAVDFYLSRRRGVNTAKAFPRKAMQGNGHRPRSPLTLTFRTAAVVIGGIELAQKIKKRQFKLGPLGGSKAAMPEIWQAALAA